MTTDTDLDFAARQLVARLERLCLTLDKPNIAESTYRTRRWLLERHHSDPEPPREPERPVVEQPPTEPAETNLDAQIGATMLNPEWRLWAACLGADPDLFFPRQGDTVNEARAICSTCTVSVECLTDAVARGERAGVRGGMSPGQRIRRSG